MMASSAAAVVDDEVDINGVVLDAVDVAFAVNRLAVDNGDIDRHLRRHFYRNHKDDEDHNNWADDVHLNSYRIDYYVRYCVHTASFHREYMLDVAGDDED